MKSTALAVSIVVLAAACSAGPDRGADGITESSSPTSTPPVEQATTTTKEETDTAYSPLASSQSPSGNLAEQPVANGGLFGEPNSFAVDPEAVRVDLAVVAGDLYISVGTPQDASLTRLTLTDGVISPNEATPWPTAGNDPVFGINEAGLGLVELPNRSPLTGAVPFHEGWAWVVGDGVAIGSPDSFSTTPLVLLDDTLLATDGDVIVALTHPVSRLNHGIVGDTIEGGGLVVMNADGTIRTQIVLDAPDVIEGRSAMLGDVTGDGRTEIVVTMANADVGAWIAVFDLDGALIGQSDAIGLGNRWRHQLAIVPDPAGPLVLNVITPHIGGRLQALRLADGRLEPIAERSQYSPHTINSRILDGAYVGDLDGDGDWEILLPNQSRNQLVALSLRDGEFVEEFVLDIPGLQRSTSNLAVIDWGNRTVLAIVNVDGLATLWTSNP